MTARNGMKIVVSDLPPYFLDLDAPTLGAEAVSVAGVTRWRVWCRHCQAWHLHGPGEGHRIAHCEKPGSPYAANGYNIVLAGKRPEAPALTVVQSTVPRLTSSCRRWRPVEDWP